MEETKIITIRRATNGFIINKNWVGDIIATDLDELFEIIKNTYKE